MRDFAEWAVADSAIELYLTSVRYRKSRGGVLLGHVEDIHYALADRHRADACVIMSDENSLLGYVKYAGLSYLMCCAPRRLAMETRGRRFPFHEGVKSSGGVQKMSRYFSFAKEVLSRLGVENSGEWEQFLPAIRKAPERPLVVLAPGGKLRTQWWPHFPELANWLHVRNIPTIVIGSTDEEALVRSVSRPGQAAMVGEDLMSVVEQLKRATLLVCNDSGLLHLAVWLGLPTVAVCGPGFARSWTGYPADRVVQLYFDSDPAGQETHGYRLACLRQIDASVVAREVQKCLNAYGYCDATAPFLR